MYHRRSLYEVPQQCETIEHQLDHIKYILEPISDEFGVMHKRVRKLADQAKNTHNCMRNMRETQKTMEKRQIAIEKKLDIIIEYLGANVGAGMFSQKSSKDTAASAVI